MAHIDYVQQHKDLLLRQHQNMAHGGKGKVRAKKPPKKFGNKK